MNSYPFCYTRGAAGRSSEARVLPLFLLSPSSSLNSAALSVKQRPALPHLPPWVVLQLLRHWTLAPVCYVSHMSAGDSHKGPRLPSMTSANHCHFTKVSTFHLEVGVTLPLQTGAGPRAVSQSAKRRVFFLVSPLDSPWGFPGCLPGCRVPRMLFLSNTSTLLSSL